MSSVYIHIPFCKHICNYCDFAKMYNNHELISNYLDGLEKEIKLKYKGEVLKTLYIGGGTPSSLTIDELRRLFEIISIFKYNDIEFTFECNVEDISDELLKFLKENNVNRLSIGIESTHDKYLKYLGRTYKREDIIKNIEIVKNYFDNISVDLIYALPGETIEELKEDIDIIKSFNIPHISTYSLIIEPHTVFYNKGVSNIDEELDREMYDLICDSLSDYKHYEISNFGISGYESKHNLVYWNNEEYYGFGLGSGGYIDNIRYLNTRNIMEYIKGKYILESDKLTKDEIVENAFILGFRKIDGINKKDFNERYNLDINNISIINNLLDEDKIEDDGLNIKIKKEYIYTSNSILCEFIGGKYYE